MPIDDKCNAGASDKCSRSGSFFMQNIFVPDNEFEAPEIDITTGEGCERPDKVDLRDVPIGTILYVAGHHPSAAYILKIVEIGGERKVKIWQSRTSNCFLAPITAIYSGSRFKPPVDQFIMELGRGFEFPYFRYNRNKVEPPRESWRDVYTTLLIKKPNL